MSHKRSLKKRLLIVVAVFAAGVLVPDINEQEPEWLKALQRKVGTRRDGYQPVWPDNFDRRSFRYALGQALLVRLEPVFAMCRVDHPEGSTI